MSQSLERRGVIEISESNRKYSPAIRTWKKMLVSSGFSCDVAFFGNSLTNQISFYDRFDTIKVANFGWGGNTLVDMYYRVGLLASSKPKKVFVMGGTNDIFYVSNNVLKIRYEKMLDSLISALPDSRIYIESILPFNHELNAKLPPNEKVIDANNIIKRIADSRGCIFIDLYSKYENGGEMDINLTTDGIHLKQGIGYELWFEEISKYVGD